MGLIAGTDMVSVGTQTPWSWLSDHRPAFTGELIAVALDLYVEKLVLSSHRGEREQSGN